MKRAIGAGVWDRTSLPLDYHDRKCPQCGKKFTCWSLEDWCYKTSEKVFCSWTCYREHGRGVKPHPGGKTAAAPDPESLKKRRYCQRDEAIEQTRQIVALKHSGKSNEECAQLMGLTVFVVVNRLQKFGRELGWVPMSRRDAAVVAINTRRKKRGKKPNDAAQKAE